MELKEFIDRSPTPLHAVETARTWLKNSGWVELKEADAWKLEPHQPYFWEKHGQGLILFKLGDLKPNLDAPRVVAAHTDSPALKIKPNAKELKSGALRYGIEIYGAPIVATWTDRELGLAGAVVYRRDNAYHHRLVNFNQPLAIIPNLALHYQREVNTKGLVYDLNGQIQALFEPNSLPEQNLIVLLANQLGVDAANIVDVDLFLYDLAAASILGRKEDGWFVSSRIDNLASCYSILSSFDSTPRPHTQVGVLFGAEEIGSMHPAGAQSLFLKGFFERLVFCRGGCLEDLYRQLARGFALSVDAAHGVHPNFSDKHDPAYSPFLGKGIVLKLNSNYRYATHLAHSAHWEELCKKAGITYQRYFVRTDLAAGSTVGPMLSAFTGLSTVDIGVPIWAMHSVRETAHQKDLNDLTQLIQVHLGVTPNF